MPTTGAPFLFQSTGPVTLGPGSVTRILPELGSPDKAIGTELALRSQINLQGKTILLRREARVLAPNAVASLKAGGWAYDEDLWARVWPFDLRPQAHEIIRTWAFYTILRTKSLIGMKPWDSILINGIHHPHSKIFQESG